MLKDNQDKEQIKEYQDGIKRCDQKIKEVRSSHPRIVRNLKICATTLNALAPFIASGMIYMIGLNPQNNGYPFIKDELPLEKEYDLEVLFNGEVLYDGHYVQEKSKDKQYLNVYTPWIVEDGTIYRNKVSYDISNPSYDLISSVLKKDYNYLTDNLDILSIEKIVSQDKSVLNNNGYNIEAHLTILDESDTLSVLETDTHNVVVTIGYILTIIILGNTINFMRNYDYLDELENIKCEYDGKKELLKYLEEEKREYETKIKNKRANYEK